MPFLIRLFLLCWTLWFCTSRSEGYIRVSGSDTPATVSPSAKLAVLHSLSPIWSAMAVNPSTGAFYGWWSVPDTFNGGNAGLISARLHGALPPASPTGTPATAETTINVVVPPKIEPIGFTATGSCSGDAYWNYYWLGPERLSSMLRKQGTFSEPDVLYESVGFTYDADSRRTYKTHTVRYTTPGKPDKVEYSKVLWCGWLPIMERRSSNGGATWTRRWFQWGVDLSGSLAGAGGINGLVAIIEETDPGTPIRTLLPVTDGLGNITAVINAANGATVATYAYGPFGEPLGETGEVDACPFRWQTKWYDAESQHYYFGYRYYSPRLGRWLSRDPLREAGGFNLYAYCGNDPVNRHDPLGLAEKYRLGDPTYEQLVASLEAKAALAPPLECELAPCPQVERPSGLNLVARTAFGISADGVGNFVAALATPLTPYEGIQQYGGWGSRTVGPWKRWYGIQAPGQEEGRSIASAGVDVMFSMTGTPQRAPKPTLNLQDTTNLLTAELWAKEIMADVARRSNGATLFGNYRAGAPEIIRYSIANASTPPLSGTRQTGIDRAWALEVQLIRLTGRGTAPWTSDEIIRIIAGDNYRNLGYTGHHINRVADQPAWAGDPRNIEFLKQGRGETHMALGHPGGTRAVQPEAELIDRKAMLDIILPPK